MISYKVSNQSKPANLVEIDNIYNLDETTIFLDHSHTLTVDLRGAQDVPNKSFGLEKSRIAAMMCANAAGEKRKPCLLKKKR